jgi:Uncharacterized conserved protein
VPSLQVCLNGARSQAEHPAVPHTPAELTRDVAQLFAAGARAFHLHVYRGGQQTLAPEAVADTLHAIRAVCPDAELAISTAEGIAATPAERARLVAGWTAWPDTLCVNLSETGIDDVLALAEARGVALEAGLWTPADVQKFRTLQHLSWRRVLLEPLSGDPDTAHAELTILLGALNDFRPDLPRLAHGIDDATWPLLRRAAALGFESRIGFEDVLTLPDQSTPAGNLDLYQAGRRLMRAGEAEASRLAHHRT